MTSSCSAEHFHFSQSRVRLPAYGLSARLAMSPSQPLRHASRSSRSPSWARRYGRPAHDAVAEAQRLAQRRLALAQRALAQVLAVEPQHVEDVEGDLDAAVVPAPLQRLEARPPAGEPDDLAVDDEALGRRVLERRRDLRVALVERQPVARLECYRPAVAEGQAAIAVELALDDPVGVVEDVGAQRGLRRLGAAGDGVGHGAFVPEADAGRRAASLAPWPTFHCRARDGRRWRCRRRAADRGAGPGRPARRSTATAPIVLAYRVRDPERRGGAVVIARAVDGERFATELVLDKDRFGAESLERPALVRTADGGWRLYVCCATPHSAHWRIDALDARVLPALAEAPPTTVFAGDERTGVKDPVIRRRAGRWEAWICCHPLDEPGHEDRMTTAYATSADGLAWEWHRTVLAPRPGALGRSRRPRDRGTGGRARVLRRPRDQGGELLRAHGRGGAASRAAACARPATDRWRTSATWTRSRYPAATACTTRRRCRTAATSCARS